MTETAHFHINLIALQGDYFRRLQHQLDMTKVLQVGCSTVSAENIAQAQDFGSFEPANGAQLSHEEARNLAHDWLVRWFLRDAIEATALFLDECLKICALTELATRGRATGEELDRVLNVLPHEHHKLPFPTKIDRLASRHGVRPATASFALSLNRARRCLVHRLGLVTEADVDQSGLFRISFLRAKAIAVGKLSGTETEIDRPGIQITEESSLTLRLDEHIIDFRAGEIIKLSPREIYDTIITLWRFGIDMGLSIAEYTSRSGHVVNKVSTEVAMTVVLEENVGNIPPAT
ncbi:MULTISPECIES: hypothetical protein [unclassified Rubrivivax]|uniref:hypothetical protein n=1 Tax=unclassified Rubrivivax TaxID=2649762 RepID=UPI001E39D4CD|nr:MULTISPECIES: hypothetical protein [unclassified Rubrivivax]MCC9597040.1 hypothetical protein [Rubrivivax sp. JA1055]MCC9646701.1 hypothetical protein [Rubrivivax sp. JA1029]